MKLLQSQFAPNPRRVRIFLAEKDINIICEEIDILKQEHKRSDFARKNPMKQVPVLIFDDGTTLSGTRKRRVHLECRGYSEIFPARWSDLERMLRKPCLQS